MFEQPQYQLLWLETLALILVIAVDAMG